jgi:hypothetical protein
MWDRVMNNSVEQISPVPDQTTKQLFHRWRKDLPEIVDTTDSSTMVDIQSDITERSTLTNEDAVEFKRKYEELVQANAKKDGRRAKKLKEKRVRRKVKDIPEINHLESSRKYVLGRLTKNVIWKSVKFWHEDLEERAVHKAMKHLEIKKKQEKSQFRDFVSAYMEENIVVKRNNTIGSIKKLVTSTNHKKSE